MHFTEVGPDVYVLRYPVLDVNVSLVLGGEVAVVVDTLSTSAQALELTEEIRRITPLPVAVVNTHHHFDHCFGNEVLVSQYPGTSVWAHEAAAAALREDGARLQRSWVEEYELLYPVLAAGIAATTLYPPDRLVTVESIMDIGGRTVELRFLGLGHTEGDLVVHVPDAQVLIAGDLVEQGSPPSFEDSHPLVWPATVTALSELPSVTTVVPGHGSTVDLDFVRAQRDELAALARLIRDGHDNGAAPEDIAPNAPFGPDAALTAARRAYAALHGHLS